MEAGDHDVKVSQEQRVVHIRLEQEGAHVSLKEGTAGSDPRLQLLEGEGAASDPWRVGLQQHISSMTCRDVLHLVILCAYATYNLPFLIVFKMNKPIGHQQPFLILICNFKFSELRQCVTNYDGKIEHLTFKLQSID